MRVYLNALPVDVREEISTVLPESVWVAIVEGATGTIHYNRPEDTGSFEIRDGQVLPGSEHPMAEGSVADAAIAQGYRRVYTVPVLPIPPTPQLRQAQDGYQTAGLVTTACNAGRFAKGDLDFAYMGGWSGNWNTLQGSIARDAVVECRLAVQPRCVPAFDWRLRDVPEHRGQDHLGQQQ